ncbi:MAG TPA: HAMP domain-containing sensor histidine kinase [Lacipirellulaceae bacterium]|nr:HAMP domain-containing sensor histidine kinase [Lacipirellulaceae bacterium]
MRWPLRNQIMAPLLAVAVASLVALAAINSQLAARQTRQRIERHLRGVVDVLRTSNFPLTAPVLVKMRELSSAEFALTDLRGQIVSSSLAEHPRRLPRGPVVTRLADVVLGEAAAIDGRDYLHTAIHLANLPGEGDDQVLHVLFPEEEYHRSWRQAFLPPLVVAIATAGLAVIVARGLAGRLSRATSRLGDEVGRLARGDFGAVELPETDDEIRDLGQAINRTAQVLADYEQQVRRTEQMRTLARLGASLAHEMRNAATGCRMAVDLHAEACAGCDEDSLNVARRQLQLMESQLQRFLQLGRARASAIRQEVHLGKLMADLLPLVRPAASHARVDLQWHVAPEEIVVWGDSEGLGQVALNLILNAIEAAQHDCGGPAHARVVSVELGLAGGAVELAVSDTGPGPPEASGATIFDPFVTTKAEGAGLGLAVARQVVEAHRGSIAWNRDQGATRFRVTLPPMTKEATCV